MKSFFVTRHLPIVAAVLLGIAALPTAAQTNYQLLKSYGAADPGTQPHAALLLGSDGALYGTTMTGGTANQGTVFRLNVNGSNYTVLHNFSTNDDGKNPLGALIQGLDGQLYGSTVYGGSNRFGTIFTLATNGSGYAMLHHFSKTSLDGMYPYGRLVQDAGGMLYGSTCLSTYTNKPSGQLTTNIGPGTIFKLNTNGTSFVLLHSFATNGLEGCYPGGLVLGLDGSLYGESQVVSFLFSRYSFPSTTGGIYKINRDGTGFTVWTNINTSGARARMNALCQGTNGLLYGTTCYSSGAGANYTVTFIPPNSYNLKSSPNTNMESVFTIGTNGTDYTVLHTFQTNGIDGQNPDTQLFQGVDGAFYGTTVTGGTNDAGTIFKLNGDGSGYAILYHFQTNSADGRWPEDSLIQRSDGTLYGTTLRGGLSDDGTVYSIQPDGSGYHQLFQFNRFGGEGQQPAGSLAADGTGSLLGVTYGGGSGGSGTLFKIGTNGNNYSIVRHFGGAIDGQWPSGQLLRGQDDAWYGTTYTGGSNNFGTIFRIRGDGNGYATLYSFSGTNDGDVPYDALVQDAAGKLYGTTSAGGTNGCGTIFTLNTNGSAFAVLHTFCTNGVDGTTPAGGLLLGNDGALYGLTEAGGTNNAGCAFKLNTDGSNYTVLHHFETNGADGRMPGARLLQGRNGALYGTTQQGGTQGAGTVFTLNSDGSGYAVLQHFSGTLTNSLTFGHGVGELLQVSGNTLYGTMNEAGENNTNGGLLFQVGTDGSGYSTVHGFGTNSGDGVNPSGRLLLAGTAWYGTTEFGGSQGAGALYSLAVVAPGLTAPPQSQTVLAGSQFSFNVVANGSPADCQWYFNGTALPNATSLNLVWPAIARTNAGTYYLTVSNLVGMATSTNALLTVYVPMQISAPQSAAAGAMQIAAAYADGWPLTDADLVRFHAQASSNLTDWVELNTPLTLANGGILLNDNEAAGHPIRFYRILENP